MPRVFANKKRTFLLTAEDGSTMIVQPNLIQDIPDKFTGDITYKRAVAGGDLQVFETTKQGEAIERKANDKATGKQGKKPEKPGEGEADSNGNKAGDAE